MFPNFNTIQNQYYTFWDDVAYPTILLQSKSAQKIAT